jgi:hypothetical protein
MIRTLWHRKDQDTPGPFVVVAGTRELGRHARPLEAVVQAARVAGNPLQASKKYGGTVSEYWVVDVWRAVDFDAEDRGLGPLLSMGIDDATFDPEYEG